MVRTKMTTRVNPSTRPQGEVAVFDPRNEATAPNIFQCERCDRRFAQRRNLTRHERNFHGEGTYRFQCPLSPRRVYTRRSDLRRHYLDRHPEADVEEVDEADMVEILPESGDGSGEPFQEEAQTGTKRKESTTTTTTGESDGKVSSPEKKKKKTPTATKTRMYEASTFTSAPVSGDAAPAPTLPQLPTMAREQERRLVKIKETITREYYFE